ncbi:MAG: hypothetical protein WDW19_06275 [Neisseriaceae bacterium]
MCDQNKIDKGALICSIILAVTSSGAYIRHHGNLNMFFYFLAWFVLTALTAVPFYYAFKYTFKKQD